MVAQIVTIEEILDELSDDEMESLPITYYKKIDDMKKLPSKERDEMIKMMKKRIAIKRIWKRAEEASKKAGGGFVDIDKQPVHCTYHQGALETLACRPPSLHKDC